MAWRVESRTDVDRWVAHDGRQWTADDVTRLNMITLADGPQPLTPTGPVYAPKGPGDEVAEYLAAVRLVPAPQVSGEPPQVPSPPAGDDAQDVVY
ncbi:hypothetical protein ACQEVY_23475 [Streptomyces sp. CA-288835]|uniref:hypothetical protein n=1 Tax=Streptomyces sp. CA-288835 TaxID=3240069 RepID=UPI003D8B05AB